jgi:ubiquinone/menaquinone biosynthesis C-methylase UbiE
VLISHLLHLVSDPQQVLLEVARVLKRPGQVVHLRAFHESPPQFEAVMDEWRKQRKSGAKSPFERATADQLFTPDKWFKIEEHRFTFPDTENPRRFLDAVKNRWWSNMWEMSDTELEIAYLAIEHVTKAQFGEDYDIEINITAGVVLQIFVPIG